MKISMEMDFAQYVKKGIIISSRTRQITKRDDTYLTVIYCLFTIRLSIDL
jgi:hypothetical protein